MFWIIDARPHSWRGRVGVEPIGAGITQQSVANDDANPRSANAWGDARDVRSPETDIDPERSATLLRIEAHLRRTGPITIMGKNDAYPAGNISWRSSESVARGWTYLSPQALELEIQSTKRQIMAHNELDHTLESPALWTSFTG